jgi:hypothetical protein
MNVVTSDGDSVAVTYTGSGWAALGALQRMAIESVSISPEEGLRVDTVLSSADGAHQVPTFFNARGARYGLFRTSDGMMILGGMVLPNGLPAGVAGALVSPGSNGETRITVGTTTEGSGESRVDVAKLHMIQPSLDGATPSNPTPTGERTPIRFETRRATALVGGVYRDVFYPSVRALKALSLILEDEAGAEQGGLYVQKTGGVTESTTDGFFSAFLRKRSRNGFGIYDGRTAFSVGANAVVDITIPYTDYAGYPATLSGVPIVQATVNTEMTSGSTPVTCLTKEITTTNFKVRVTNGTSGTRTGYIHWTAYDQA